MTSDTSPRLRVLVVAEAANPEWVSTPLVAWSHYRALARRFDVHLVTQARNAEAILRAGVPPDAFTAIDSERVAAPLWRVASRLRGGEDRGWTTLRAFGALAYYEFERLLWRELGGRIEAGEFDLVHRVAPISPTWPSAIVAGRCARAGVPFVLGPLNGGLPWPPGFGSVRRQEGEWLSFARGAHRLLPGYRATRRHASAIVIGSRATWEATEARWRDKCVYIPENAIDPERFPLAVERPPAIPLRVAFVGRMVPCKGVDMLLEAAAPLVREGRVTLDLIGDGPERPKLRALAQREDIAAGVRLEGWIEHEKLAERLVESDVFGFPSIHEFGGGAICEAMALGLFPVVVDYGGPAEIVGADGGRVVPLGSRQAIVADLRHELAELAADPAAARAGGRRARARVLELFTWEAKARQMQDIYDWALGRRRTKPDFGMPLARATSPEEPPS